MNEQQYADLTGTDIVGEEEYKNLLRDIRNQLNESLQSINPESRVYCEVSDSTIIVPEYGVGEINPEKLYDIFYDATSEMVSKMTLSEIAELVHYENGPMKDLKVPPISETAKFEDLENVISTEIGFYLQAKAIDDLRAENSLYEKAFLFPGNPAAKESTRVPGNQKWVENNA